MSRVVLAAVAASMMALAGAAQAAIVTLTFDGTVASGIDDLGTFGAAGANLAGDAFSATAMFDDTLGVVFVQAGRTFRGGTSLISSASLIVNGTSLDLSSFAEDGVEDSYVQNTPTLTSAFAAADGRDASNFGYRFDAQAANPTIVGSTLVLTDGTTPGLGFLDLPGTTHQINFQVTSATISPVPAMTAAPEPAMWALMILGFGAAGARLRRRAGLLA